VGELRLDKLHEEVHGGGLVGIVDEEHKGLLVAIEEVGQLAGVLFKDGLDELGDGGESEAVDSVVEGQGLLFGEEVVDVQKQGFVVDNRGQSAHVDQRLPAVAFACVSGDPQASKQVARGR